MMHGQQNNNLCTVELVVMIANCVHSFDPAKESVRSVLAEDRALRLT